VGIVDEDIARVRAATDFLALASEHLALRRVGTRWVGLCPFHVEKSPSFSLNAEEGFYYCFGCGAKGDVITFVRELVQLDFVEAVEYLAQRAGIALRYDDASGSRDHQRRNRIHETLEAAISWYHERLLAAPDAAAARRYLRVERGYDGEVVRRYRLGWAPDGWDSLVRALRQPAGALVDAGLAQRDGRGHYRDVFRARVLFPIYDASGKPVGLGGRILPGGRPPKYKNTAGTAVYDKSSVLYGLNWAKRAAAASGTVVVCEGYTDVIGLHRSGVEEAVAVCGTALADGHLRTLTRFARRIVLAYDADGAGRAAADRVYAWERRHEVDIRVADLPSGADPADLAARDPSALEKAIREARPFLSFQLERLFARADLASAEGRVRAATEAVGLIARHPDPLVADQYVMEVADRCRVPAERLRGLLGAAPRGEPAGTAPTTAGDLGAGTARRGIRGGPPGTAEQSEGSVERPGRAGRAAAGTAERAAPAIPGPELAALRLAVHRPDEVVDRLDGLLLRHPLAAAAYATLAGAAELHEALDAADPEVSDLLHRLAVEECDEAPDDVMARLCERAAERAVAELQAEMRAVPAQAQEAYVASLTWLEQALQVLRSSYGSLERGASRQVEATLLPWLVQRESPPGQHDGEEGS
jgi:DNA primase